jgi:hypothetical protein
VVILLSLQLGWGLWLMPQAFATFGWLAVLVIAGSAAATWLSGSLYGRLCSAVPDATSLADVGNESHQRTGRNMAAGFVILTQILMCLVLQLAAATSLQHTLKGITPNQPDEMLPLWLAQVIVGCAVAVASQLRQLAKLSWLCYVGNIAQLIAACLLAAGMLSDMNCRSDSTTGQDSCGAAESSGGYPYSQHAWLHYLVTLLGVVFAYGGQYAYVDVAHQMRCRTAFTAMQHASTGIMTVLYLLFGAMVYAARGPAAAELQVFAANGPAALSRTAVACVLVQTVVQLVISVYIWTTTLVTWYMYCSNGCKAVCSRTVCTTLQCQDTAKPTAAISAASSVCSMFLCDPQRDIEGQRDLPPNTLCTASATGVDGSQGEPPLVPQVTSQQQAASSSLRGLQQQAQSDPGAVSAGRFVWCVGSCASIAVSAVVSSFVPSIKHLAGVLAAGSDLMLAYGVPCLFAAVLLRDVMPVRHRAWVAGALRGMFVVSLLASIAGVAVSVLSFVSGSRD